MGAEGLIAGRLRFRGKMAVTAVAVSFFVMIVAVAISGGFRREIRNTVSAACGDVVLSASSTNYYGETDPVSSGEDDIRPILENGGVRSVTPAVYRAGVVKAGDDICGVLVKGIPVEDTVALGVKIPVRLANAMKLAVGDDMLTYFIGENVKLRKFKVAGIYDNPVEAGEQMVVYASISDMRRLNGWSGSEASVLELSLDEKLRTREGMRSVAADFSTDYVALSTPDRYSQIFDWLDLIDFNVVAILILMTVVAGFNMISGLLILLFQNVSTIGILKSVGMTDRSISRVFLKVSARLVALGMLAGNAAALLFCAFQAATHLIKLNPENYFVSFVPVSVNLPLVLAADAIAFVVIMLLVLIPTAFISRMDPALTAKAE
ncbi:MAG: FtsX-like permease family protein [Bacteroidales bacterium]|nr:FtsX-like permease family protein [Bacteroidales bacterium]